MGIWTQIGIVWQFIYMCVTYMPKKIGLWFWSFQSKKLALNEIDYINYI